MHFGSRTLHLWISTFSESILLFVFLSTSAPLTHIQWVGEAGTWTDVGRRAFLPQCRASGLLKTLPNRAFVNCWGGGASEVIQAASGVHCWKSLSRLCLQSIFVLSSYHVLTTQHAAALWTGPGNWSDWKLTQLKGGKEKGGVWKSFPASSDLWSHLPHSSTNSCTTTREVTSSHSSGGCCQLFLRQQPKPLPYGPAP